MAFSRRQTHSEPSEAAGSLIDARRPRKSGRSLALVVTGALGVASVIAAPLAQAASYTYANNVSTAENQVRDSGVRSSIRGGNGTLQSFSADGAGTIMYMETYLPAPGYRTIMIGEGGSSVNMSHAATSSAAQKCRWDWPWAGGNIGSLTMTCATK